MDLTVPSEESLPTQSHAAAVEPAPEPAARPARDRIVRVATLAALFLLAAATTRLLLSGWAVDPDSFFHIASGRWIVEHRVIPTTDVLSWYGMANRAAWLPHEWLFDVGIYLLWKALGFQGMFAAASLLLASAILAARRLAELRGAAWLPSLGIALVALAGMARFISPRPGAVTFLLLPLIAILLERDRWMWALLLFVLGMNVHGGAYPIYLLVVLYFATPKRPWVALAACVLVLAQPLGFGLLKYPFVTLSPLAGYITEFQPTQLGTDFLFLGVIAACWLLVDRQRAGGRELVAAAVLLALGLQSVRTQAYYYLLGLPILAPAFRLPAWRPKGVERAQTARPRTRSWDVAVVTGLLACALLVSLSIRWPIDPDRGYPRGAMDYVRSHGITRFWNEWNDGGYLMFNGMPPFVDGRSDPFDPFFNPKTMLALDYMRTYRRQDDIRRFLAKYGVRTLIVHRDTGLYQVLVQSRDFRLLYEDAGSSVFEFTPAGT